MFLEYLASSSGLEKTLNKSARANAEKFKAKQVAKAPTPKYTLEVTKETPKETPKATTAAETVVDIKTDKPKPDEEFTAEEDAKLLALKKNNKSWKDIAAELNKVQWVVKKRHKEISANPTSNDTTTATSVAVVTAEVNTKKARKGSKSVAAATDAATVEASSAGPQVIMEEDEDFTAEDLLVLSRIVHADYEMRWQRVASRFFDETGKRVHPMSVKEKVDGAD